MRTWAGVAVVVGTAIGTPLALAKAEALWKSQRPRSYEMTVDVLCPGLCYPMPSVPPVFEVTDDRARQVGGGTIDFRSHAAYEGWNTVERLFVTIRQVATAQPYKLTIRVTTFRIVAADRH